MIYETDTNRVLVWDNAAWVMIADTDQPPGLQLVKAQTVGTTVSSVTVSDAFSADYNNYKIMYSGGTSTTGTNLSFQLQGVTTSVYFGGAFGTNFSTGAFTGAGMNAQTKWEYAGYAQGGINFMNFDLYSPFLSTRTWYSANPVIISSVGYGAAIGECTDANSRTGFVIAPVAGTLTGGTIRVYGYRN
jgi:hypothetical protein